MYNQSVATEMAPLAIGPSLKDSLANKLKHATDHLEALKKCLDFLDKNPDMEQFLDALRRAGL